MSMVEELPPEVQGPLREALGSAFPSGLDSAMDSEMKASPGLSLDEANMTDIVENLQGLATSHLDHQCPCSHFCFQSAAIYSAIPSISLHVRAGIA